jgi:hypothetical protein
MATIEFDILTIRENAEVIIDDLAVEDSALASFACKACGKTVSTAVRSKLRFD